MVMEANADFLLLVMIAVSVSTETKWFPISVYYCPDVTVSTVRVICTSVDYLTSFWSLRRPT